MGPISAVVLIMEFTGRDLSFILPLIPIAGISMLIARSTEQRSIYDARLSDEQVIKRQKLREEESNHFGETR
jgi:chloride channel protein, CIC family